jgi:hypothetical protein
VLLLLLLLVLLVLVLVLVLVLLVLVLVLLLLLLVVVQHPQQQPACSEPTSLARGSRTNSSERLGTPPPGVWRRPTLCATVRAKAWECVAVEKAQFAPLCVQKLSQR